MVNEHTPYLTLFVNTGQLFLVFLIVLFQYSFKSWVSWRFGENFETKSWVGCGQFQHLVEELSSALDRICLVAKRGVQYLFESLRCRLNHSLEKILFTGEVKVDRSFAYPKPLRNVVHRRFVVSFFREDFVGRFQDSASRFFLVLRHDLRHSAL